MWPFEQSREKNIFLDVADYSESSDSNIFIFFYKNVSSLLRKAIDLEIGAVIGNNIPQEHT